MIRLHSLEKEKNVMNEYFHAANIVGGSDGCGAWRMLWPSHAINLYGKGYIHDVNQSHAEINIVNNVCAIRVQRFCSPTNHQLLSEIIKIRDAAKSKLKLIWEVDDIIFPEDIPDYNSAKKGFVAGFNRGATLSNINSCDEVSVTCPFLRDYLVSKTGKKEITAIPNFVPDWLYDNFFDVQKSMKSLSQHKKKPRILYTGSQSHASFNPSLRIPDDFTHVMNQIIGTVRDFQWVFLGVLPFQLRPLVDKGLIEHHGWSPLLSYPKKLSQLDVNAVVVPLADNVFNRAKSNIKLTEFGFMGVPVIAQDLEPYVDCEHRFRTGPEMIDQIKRVLSDTDRYRALIKRQYDYSRSFSLSREENLSCIKELYVTKYGSERKFLPKHNA